MPTDPKQIVRKVIVGFPWDDFGLDEVGMIKPMYAEYADALADRIVKALAKAKAS
jgi:hypothetical protein